MKMKTGIFQPKEPARLRLALGLILAVCFASPASQLYDYELIATNGGPIPTSIGNWNIASFNHETSVNQAGTVAFVGTLSVGRQEVFVKPLGAYADIVSGILTARKFDFGS